LLSPPTQRQTNIEPIPTSSITEFKTNTREIRETIVDGNRSSSRLSVAQQTEQRVESPAPSLINRTTDEFLKNIPFKINTFEEVVLIAF
jgi:hypothetical protein